MKITLESKYNVDDTVYAIERNFYDGKDHWDITPCHIHAILSVYKDTKTGEHGFEYEVYFQDWSKSMPENELFASEQYAKDAVFPRKLAGLEKDLERIRKEIKSAESMLRAHRNTEIYLCNAIRELKSENK